MVLNNKIKIGLGAFIALLLLSKKSAAAAAGYSSIISKLSPFLQSLELYRAKPYWDVMQWSWGYGSRVPGSVDNKNIVPTGSISRSDAMNEMLKHIEKDYNYLRPMVQRPLSAGKWSAFLSFSYNLGPGNADNLLDNINSGNDYDLEIQWKKYIYAGGVISDHHIERRAKEWQLWESS
jgi:GH24 family phage-related lysozyme (muramidase)